MFGMPAEDDGTRTDLMLGHNVIGMTQLRARLRRAPARTDADRPGRRRRSRTASWPSAAARRSPSGSGARPSRFPGDHGGFLGGEYGQTGEPDAFAAKLREVLEQA